MKTYSRFKAGILKGRKILRAYGAFGPEFEVAASLIKRRLERGFTQRELARRVGTKQSAIARLESGTYNPSIDLLKRVTRALDARLTITVTGR